MKKFSLKERNELRIILIIKFLDILLKSLKIAIQF